MIINKTTETALGDDGKENQPKNREETTVQLLEIAEKEIQQADELIAETENFIQNLALSSADESPELKTLNEDLKELKNKKEQFEILKSALEVSNTPLPLQIENLTLEQKKTLNTSVIHKGEDVLAKDKLDEQSQTALAILYTEILNENEYPAIPMGSLPKTLYVENALQSNDADIALSVNDLPVNYQKLIDLQKDGRVKDLTLIPLKSYVSGEPNDAFEVKFDLRTNKKDEEIPEWKECSLLYNNIDTEKEDNGYVSAGYKENTVNLYKVGNSLTGEDVLVPFLDKEGTKKLYSLNLLIELEVFNFNSFQESRDKYPWITPKALFRINNLLNLCGNDFKEVFKNVKSVLDSHGSDKVRFKNTIGMMGFSKKEYQKGAKRQMNEENRGLFEFYARESSLDESDKEQIISNFSKQMIQEMNFVNDIYSGITESSTKENIKSAKEEILKIQDKYQGYLNNVDYKNTEDFTLFVGAREMVISFTGVALLNLNSMLDKQL